MAKSYFEIPDWTTSEGSNPFDETLARTRLLQQAGMAPTIINLDWTPRLRAYQQRDGWQDQPVLGLYDDLQLATDVQERVLSIRDLNWPSDVLFFTTDGGLFVYQGATRIAEAFMNPMMTDRLDVVRYFADGQVVAENRYDYRGFLSQRIEYENGQPTTRRFYSPGAGYVASIFLPSNNKRH
ncbi:accessory Sec system glycosyltransferase Asp1 [Weissella cibaria]|uniref:accessory Sec system glycosyltransferase Asp1 n=1 Tax=Weissella cibaria TaxID=137591 RepID=UPI001644B0BE|nr:accessory Sec system glycosyltransferase Asp1 [Weissella cibaria]